MTRRYPVILLIALFLVLGVVIVAAHASKEKTKEGQRAFLGVVLDEVTDEVTSDYGVKQGKGALILSVSPHTPADKAGLRANDVIVKFDETPIESPDDLRKMLREKNPGDVARLGIVRGGKEQSVEVTLGEPKSIERSEYLIEGDKGTERCFRKLHKAKMADKRAYAGIHLQELSEGLAKYFEVKEGVLISDVEEDSPAKKAGLEAGDIILSIDDSATEDVGDVQRLVRGHEPKETAKFKIVRKGNTKTIEVELGEKSLGCGLFYDPALPGFQFFHGRGEFPGDLEDLDIEIEVDEVKGEVHELLEDLRPELEKLKARLQELEQELKRLKEEGFQKKM